MSELEESGDAALEPSGGWRGRFLSSAAGGVGPIKGALEVADEHLAQASGDVEQAIHELVRTHTRLMSTSGAATSLGGLPLLPVAIPTGLAASWFYSCRMVLGVAHLRGYDVWSDRTRSIAEAVVFGRAVAEPVNRFGQQAAGVVAKGRVARVVGSTVRGSTLWKINRFAGGRVITKGGQKGLVNLTKLAPLAAAPVGAASEIVTARAVGSYAKQRFPARTASTDEEGRA